MGSVGWRWTDMFHLGYLVRQLRERNQPAPCRKCRGPILAPGATCPVCGHQPADYTYRQASRFLKGCAIGFFLGALASWYITGHVDVVAGGFGGIIVGALLCCLR